MAFVYATDIRARRNGVNELLTVKVPSAIVYPVGVVNSTDHLEQSKRFLAFLKTIKVINILASFGFVQVQAPLR